MSWVPRNASTPLATLIEALNAHFRSADASINSASGSVSEIEESLASLQSIVSKIVLGPIPFGVKTIRNQSYALGERDGFLVVSNTTGGAITITLPDVVKEELGRQVVVHALTCDASNEITVTPRTGQEIAGASSVAVTTSGTTLWLISYAQSEPKSWLTL